MSNYYVTAVVTRLMTESEEKQIAVSGRIYVARCKTIVMAESVETALSAGIKHITDILAGSGLHASDFGAMPVDDAEKLGDTEIYDRYPTPEEVVMRRKNA